MDFVKANATCLEAGKKPIVLRGYGLGGWLLPEGYMWKIASLCDRPRRMETMIERLCGREYATLFWKKYYDCYITERDFDYIEKAGLNCVRLPINARHLQDGSAWTYIDRCVTWGRSRGIYTILDMHAAPGGQTGQNIDDCENDRPELFENEQYQQMLITLWEQLARRYRNEPAVAGYDLLNEPLPNFFSQYNHCVLPLYRKLTAAIRAIDQKHLLIVEGLHWATDFSLFSELETMPLDNNCMLQFHKYWSPPDKAGIQEFLDWSKRLNIPLFMGEGGENNLDWYVAAFALYERCNISWSFWSYKKMDCKNSPMTFDMPFGWENLQLMLDETGNEKQAKAMRVFDQFLQCITNCHCNPAVNCAILHQAPLTIPAEHFDACTGLQSKNEREGYRADEGICIRFESGKTGVPNYRQLSGEPSPQSENLQVLLFSGEKVCYDFSSTQACHLFIVCKGAGRMEATIHKSTTLFSIGEQWQCVNIEVPKGNSRLTIACMHGLLLLEEIQITNLS